MRSAAIPGLMAEKKVINNIYDRGELLYEEEIPESLRPPKILSGQKWSIFEMIGRFFELFLALYGGLLLVYGDLSVPSNVIITTFSLVGFIVLFYLVEIRGPAAFRSCHPILLFSNGIAMYFSQIEMLRGRRVFTFKDWIDHIKVKNITITSKGEKLERPTEMIIFLKRGGKIKISGHSTDQLEKMIRVLKEQMNVKVQ